MAERILIVDDEHIVCRGLEKILQSAGFEAHSACSGKEAIEKTKQNEYGLVFVDLVMPEMDGIQTCKELRKIGTKASIVSMTGKLDEDPIHKEVAFTQAGGISHYLYKPFAEGEILNVAKIELGLN